MREDSSNLFYVFFYYYFYQKQNNRISLCFQIEFSLNIRFVMK